MATANKFSPDNPFAFASDNPFTAETSGEAFIKTGGREFINNIFGIPSAAGEALAFGAAGAETGAANLFDFGNLPGLSPDDPTFDERFQEQREKFPASALRAFRPTIEGLTADVRSLPKLLPGGETFGESRQRLRKETAAATAQRQEQFPGATGAGEVAGDVATLLSGRLPASKAINKLEQKLFGKGPDMAFGSAVPKITNPGLKRAVKEVLTGPAAKSLARGAGRSLEIGFEAAALDLLKGDDPFETAGYAMGVQAGGSAILGLGKGAIKHPGIAITALSFAALLQVSRSLIPGGKDGFIESVETGFAKVAFGLLLGAVAGAAGTGRLRGAGRRIEDFPRFADAITAVPRGAVISMLEDFVDADPAEQQNIELVMNKLAENPAFFGKDITKKLQSAMENNRFAEELRELQKDKKFKQKLFSLTPPKLPEQ